MNHPPITPEERFATVVEELLYHPGVTPPTGGKKFGASGLKIQNKIFVMLSQGRLIAKLPKVRVDELVASGDGERFDPTRRGRYMKEWIVLEPASDVDWLSLAQEAVEFVSSKH